MKSLSAVLSAALAVSLFTGCGSDNPAPKTGFIGDYSKLKVADDGAMRYMAPSLKNYDTFLIDPLDLRNTKLDDKQSSEVSTYFSKKFSEELMSQGYKVVNTPGPGVARVRIAITKIQDTTWWMNVHPATKVTGAGTGGAAMEGEVLDSVSGTQLAAVIQQGKGSQFTLNSFSTIDDVKGVIDKWAGAAVTRLNELKGK